jgi:hypothetical protein
MRRALGWLVPLSLLLLTTACVDVEETVTLSPDLSGEATFSVVADLEPMVETLANTQHLMAGESGAATPAELEAARQQMMAEKNNQPSLPSMEELNEHTPPGVQVLESHGDQQGTKLSAKVRVSFKSLEALSQLALSRKAETDPKPQSLDHPFEGLQVKDEGKTLLISVPLTNPMGTGGAASSGMTSTNAPSQVKSPTGNDPTAAVSSILKTMKFGFRLRTPFEVVETNATRRDGSTLVWEYDWVALSQRKADGRGLFVRVRKPS